MDLHDTSVIAIRIYSLLIFFIHISHSILLTRIQSSLGPFHTINISNSHSASFQSQFLNPKFEMIRLPSHTDAKISDPLSILDSDEVLVPYWDFLVALLLPFIDDHGADEEPAIRLPRFIDVLGTISYSLTGNGLQDLSLLSESASATRLSRLIGPIVKCALSMEELFVDGTLPTLGDFYIPLPLGSNKQPVTASTEGAISAIALSGRQISCLVCHMVLGTFSKPTWMAWDGPNLGPVWFADDGKGDRNIKKAYIQVLLAYLEEELITEHSQPPGHEIKTITFSLVNLHWGSIDAQQTPSLLQPGGTESSSKPLIPLSIYLLEEEDDDYEPCFTPGSVTQGSEEFCQLISANKEIGFGPTATQEERVFGSNPALLPSVLMTPPLSAVQSLVITGNTHIYGHFTGHLRSAQLRRVYKREERRVQSRIRRSFLFLDALEMDGKRHGKDLEMDHMHREIHKLTSGFGALHQTPSDSQSTNERRFVLVVPPWGCGTFGGDFQVKLLLIWMAASTCGIGELRLAVKSAWWHALNADWRNLIERMRGRETQSKCWKAEQVWQLLRRLEKGAGLNRSIDWLDY